MVDEDEILRCAQDDNRGNRNRLFMLSEASLIHFPLL